METKLIFTNQRANQIVELKDDVTLHCIRQFAEQKEYSRCYVILDNKLEAIPLNTKFNDSMCISKFIEIFQKGKSLKNEPVDKKPMPNPIVRKRRNSI